MSKANIGCTMVHSTSEGHLGTFVVFVGNSL